MSYPKGPLLMGQLSIHRAVLCAADELAKQVLQVEKEIDIPSLQPTQFFTDSEDVLAWLNNNKDIAKRYITSRHNRICTISDANQGRYIPTNTNPADVGTRPSSVDNLKKSDWIKGPAFLYQETARIPVNFKDEPTNPILFIAPSRSFF